MTACSLINGIIILIICILRVKKWCWKLPILFIIFRNGRNWCSLFKTTEVIVCLQIDEFYFVILNILHALLWKCLLMGEIDWKLRLEFQKASLIPTNSARPHQNVDLILNLDMLLFLPFEWGTQRWSSTGSSSATGQLTMLTFLHNYFSSVTGLQ